MPIFSPGDVVRVPFPYIEADVREMRPALVVSAAPMGPDESVFWGLMITSAANRGWAGDVSLETDHAECGLPVPSVIRTEKIAALDVASARRLGQISKDKLAAVRENLTRYLSDGQ